MSKEQVNHPEHYGGKDNPYEAIKIIDAMGWGKGFCLGNALKYIIRAGKKDNNSTKQDLDKAIWYLKHYIELIDIDIKKCEKYINDIDDFVKIRESEELEFSLKENEVIKILESISDITPKFKDKVVEILKLKPDSTSFSSELGVKMTDIFNK